MSVDVAEFAPGVTDVEDRVHIATVAGPVTVHESRMGLLKAVPATGAMAMTSVTWLPSCAVKLAEAGRSEKSGEILVPKVAVTK